MINLITKWGAVIVLLIAISSIIMVFAHSFHGISNWFGDNYLPKKYMIIEKYPIRIIMYGQFENFGLSENRSSNRTDGLLKILQTMDKMEYKEGNFSDYNININVNSDFNSKQVRSSLRKLDADFIGN